MPVPKGAGREKASTASAGVTCHTAGMVVEGTKPISHQAKGAMP
jgi:hypothetical protein